LDKCDREEQRWTQAYAGKVINLAELKGCRAEIAARRESIFTQRQQLQTTLDTIGLAVEHGEALIGYCARVRQKVQTFGAAEQRLAIEALNVRVTWTPEAPLAIEGTIPFDEIVPLPLEKGVVQLALGLQVFTNSSVLVVIPPNARDGDAIKKSRWQKQDALV
jgi:hypothetical protein